MDHHNQNSENAARKEIGRWVTDVRAWILFTLTLVGLMMTGVNVVNGLRQDVAVLTERVNLLLSDHEKRITQLEAKQEANDSRLNRLEATRGN